MGEFFQDDWYREALKASEMRLGNNVRLKRVIERAMAGEQITIATIGGSITEGAGASNYRECWASRFAVRFGNTYGVNNGSNVTLINAGVGGTASTYGYMRYGRDITERVRSGDPDGYADLVIIEYSVNDWEEPTRHRCFESMVREILEQPNEPAVILLFAVFRNGWNLQEELRKIGDRYDLMMVSIRNGMYPHIGREIAGEDFFFDEYHPKSLGHRTMADCLSQTVRDAAEKETDAQDIDLSEGPVYGTDFKGLRTIYAGRETEGITVDRGSFTADDTTTYRNRPVGRVCGANFCHEPSESAEPLKITGMFSKCLIAWKAAAESTYGAAEVLVDGRTVTRLSGGEGKWGQSEVVLVLDESEAAEHTVEIRPADPGKRFTVTAISVK